MTNAMEQAEIEKELSETDDLTPTDHGADALPFGHLSGSRFELLIYLLEREEKPDASVSILKVSGDRGRDVLVYRNGRLYEIIQCKNLQDRLTEPSVRHEILKLALHGYLDREVLPSLSDAAVSVTLEICAPSGFTEPAALFVDTWPNSLNAEDAQSTFLELQRSYAKFKALQWDHVRETVTQKIPASVHLRKSQGADVSMRIRKHPALYSRFFRGGVFAPMDYVAKAVKEAMSSVHWRQLDEDNLRRLTDRTNKFPVDQRIYLGMGYIFGMTPAFMALLSREEFKKVTEITATPTVQLIQIALKASQRIIAEAVLEEHATLSSSPSAQMLGQLIMSYAAQKCAVGQWKRLPNLPTSGQGSIPLAMGSFEQELPRISRETWEAYQRVLDPNFVPPTEDATAEDFRIRIAKAALTGHDSAEGYVQTAKAAYQEFRAVVDKVVAKLHALLPKDLMVVSDLNNPFQDKASIENMVRALGDIDQRLPKQEHNKDVPKITF